MFYLNITISAEINKLSTIQCLLFCILNVSCTQNPIKVYKALSWGNFASMTGFEPTPLLRRWSHLSELQYCADSQMRRIHFCNHILFEERLIKASVFYALSDLKGVSRYPSCELNTLPVVPSRKYFLFE